MFGQHLHLFDELRWHFIDLQTEKILDLRREKQHRNPAGEAHRYGVGNVFDHRAEPGHPHEQQKNAGDDCADCQIIEPVLHPDSVKNNDESARRSTNANARAAQRRKLVDAKCGSVRSGAICSARRTT